MFLTPQSVSSETSSKLFIGYTATIMSDWHTQFLWVTWWYGAKVKGRKGHCGRRLLVELNIRYCHRQSGDRRSGPTTLVASLIMKVRPNSVQHTHPHTAYLDLNCRRNKAARSSHHSRCCRRCSRWRCHSPPCVLPPSSQMAILPFLTAQSQSLGCCSLGGSWNGHSG